MKRFKYLAAAAITLLILALLTACGIATQDVSEHVLVGTWNWDDNALWQYTFNEDGTGVRGFLDERETFNWSIPNDGHVRMNMGRGSSENWDYILDGDMLTLDSRQVPGLTYHYVREGATLPINPALVESWGWEDSALYEYVFNEDGTGRRGFPDEIETFTWTTPEAGHIRMDIAGGTREHWNYTIAGDRLTLTSRQVEGLTFTYIRQSANTPRGEGAAA